jgi:hypothetical protein
VDKKQSKYIFFFNISGKTSIMKLHVQETIMISFLYKLIMINKKKNKLLCSSLTLIFVQKIEGYSVVLICKCFSHFHVIYGRNRVYMRWNKSFYHGSLISYFSTISPDENSGLQAYSFNRSSLLKHLIFPFWCESYMVKQHLIVKLNFAHEHIRWCNTIHLKSISFF